jgi:pimeloyl-ACP methyl ester carboxylesterase
MKAVVVIFVLTLGSSSLSTSFLLERIGRSHTSRPSTATDQSPTSPLFSGIPVVGKQSEKRDEKSIASITTTITKASFDSKTEMRSYEHDGWKLTYRYRPASPGHENEPPILLIHPVGIGISSWFWERTMNAFPKGPAMLAPNLIGCGVSEGSDAWNPDERGLFIPLDWVKGCEALMAQYFDDNKRAPWQGILRNSEKSYSVVAQGGLAPIGVLLAGRNPKLVKQLVLASPPTWKDMTTTVEEKELARNYNFLRSPIWGSLAFKLLETRKAVSFFSNLFLFSNPCDDFWIDAAARESLLEARAPVMVFNSGFCLNKGLESELSSLQQPTLIVEGRDDTRKRNEYTEKMANCEALRLPGKNVIPWEYPKDFAQALAERI